MSRLTGGALAVALTVASLQVAAQQPAAPLATAPAGPPRIDVPRILPGTRPEAFSAIQGSTLTSTNAVLANAALRLRDARSGQIVQLQSSDQAGLFAFRSVDPGSYIVEILGEDQFTVLAASPVLTASAGDEVSAIVRLPFRLPPWAGALGNSPSAAAVIAASAASAGVLATQVTGAATCDTLQ